MLDQAALRDAVTGRLWTSVTVVPSTGSTNADLLAADGPEGQVLVAEEQTAGRGRMGRNWVSEPGAALTFSILLRPDAMPAARRGWLPLIAGVAVALAVRAVSGLDATLKWPNDVLIGDRKLCGILAEQSGTAVVVGIGINVATPADALPGGLAGPGGPAGPGGLRPTSLAVEGVEVARDLLLVEVLRLFEQHYLDFRKNPDPAAIGLLAEYRALCGTLGRKVRVELPAARTLTGEATGIDSDGRLLVTDAGITTATFAGDVIHVR